MLYQELANHTLPKCRTCRVPLSCCSPEYCETAIEHAATKWGVVLVRTTHVKLPLMGPTGCTAAPHLRPLCTYHTCKVNSLGCEPGDPAWNDKYFQLRTDIDELEAAHVESSGSV